MLKPQSLLRSLPSTPQLLEMIVRSLALDSLTAFTRFIGTPQKPNPPTRMQDPSLIPQIALATSVQIFEEENLFFKCLKNIKILFYLNNERQDNIVLECQYEFQKFTFYNLIRLIIFHSMGSEICSGQIIQKQPSNQKGNQMKQKLNEYQFHQQSAQNVGQSLDQYDNPSRIHDDFYFLKTSFTASNDKMTIAPKARYSLNAQPDAFYSPLLNFKTPSLCKLEQLQLSIGNKKTTSRQTITQGKEKKQVMQKPAIFGTRQRRLSLEYALQNKISQESKNDIKDQSSEAILRQVSDFILSQRNLFTPKKIEKSIFVKNRFQQIVKQYKFAAKIGEGSYGNVYKAYHKENSELRAIKILKKSKLSKNQHEKTINQIEILKKLDHPSILKLFQIYYDTKSVSIVTEFCQGGSLFKIANKNRLNIQAIKLLFRKLLTALAYLHHSNIVHRDIKLDNIVLVNKFDASNQQSIDIRLIDFGLSKFATVKRFKDRQKIGTYTHMAPQVIDGLYSTKSDIWSAGIVLCYLILGFNPFKGTTRELTFEKIQGEELKFESAQWKKVNIQLKDLIMRMLDKRLSHRITAADALNHPWLQIEQKAQQKKLMLEIVTKKLYDYYRGNNLVTIVQSYIAYTTTPQAQINEYSWIFSLLDKDHDGCISKDQLQHAFNTQAIGFEKKQMEYVLQKVQQYHYGKLNFTEFVSILSDRQKNFSKRSLIQAFHYLDHDNSGFIDKKELKQVLNTNESELSSILKEIDSNKDFKISQDQFVKYIQDGNFY